MHPSLSRAFQRHQEHDLKHPGLVDLIATKQNKLPSFMDRYHPFQCLLGKRVFSCSIISDQFQQFSKNLSPIDVGDKFLANC
jgi:hypothetical protein